MYHIAVCGNDRIFISYIKKILNQGKDNKQFQFTIYECCSEEDLVNDLAGIGQLDILILAEEQKRMKREYIIGHYRNSAIKVNVKNILYIENAKRGSRITVCANCPEAKFDGPILVDDKLDALSTKFSELVFAHCSYIINVNHIEKIENNEVYLDNGECLTVSRTYRKTVWEKFIKSHKDKY